MTGDLRGRLVAARRWATRVADASPSGLSSARAAEVLVRRTNGEEARGSGYLLRTGLLLTAEHVVRDAERVGVRARTHDTAWSANAAVRWSDPGVDVALLALSPGEGPPPPRVRRARFGAVVEKDATLRATALGFPRWKLRERDDRTRFRETGHTVGTIALLANARGGTLEFRVPRPDDDPRAWEGMSGAAVWAQGRIIGIVAEHHPWEGPGRLTVRRADRWLKRVGTADGVRALREAGLAGRLRRVGPWRRAARVSGAAAVVVAAAVFSGLRLDAAHPLPPLSLRMVGSCTHVGQELHSRSANFTPHGYYRDEVLTPDGRPYPLRRVTGRADGDGSVNVAWNCSADDVPGTYHVRVTDETTQRRTGWVPFTVKSAPYVCDPHEVEGHWYEGLSATDSALLEPGSAGRDVAEAQCLLLRLGYSLGPYGVDGVYGPATQTAVTQVQQRGGAQGDGVVGARTWQVLRSATGESAGPPGAPGPGPSSKPGAPSA